MEIIGKSRKIRLTIYGAYGWAGREIGGKLPGKSPVILLAVHKVQLKNDQLNGIIYYIDKNITVFFLVKSAICQHFTGKSAQFSLIPNF